MKKKIMLLLIILTVVNFAFAEYECKPNFESCNCDLDCNGSYKCITEDTSDNIKHICKDYYNLGMGIAINNEKKGFCSYMYNEIRSPDNELIFVKNITEATPFCDIDDFKKKEQKLVDNESNSSLEVSLTNNSSVKNDSSGRTQVVSVNRIVESDVDNESDEHSILFIVSFFGYFMVCVLVFLLWKDKIKISKDLDVALENIKEYEKIINNHNIPVCRKMYGGDQK